MSRIYDWAGAVVRGVFDRRMTGASVLDAAVMFPAGRDFQAAWHAIALETDAIAQGLDRVPRFHELMPAQAEISANDERDWRLFVLKAYGVAITSNLARCPTLAALLRDHPEVISASISFLAPGKHIPAHRGPFRGVMRFHLGLRVPLDENGEPAAVLTIEGRRHALSEGQCLLWDDTFVHEVRNHSSEVRSALLLDVRRPFMPPSLKLASWVVIAAVHVCVRWQRRFGVVAQ